MAPRNAFYAQSGGVTAVLNATACGLIESARQHPDQIGHLYAGRNGIIGALREDLIDTGQESAEAISALRYTPAAAFGSCRYKLKGLDENRAEYERLIEVFAAHDIGYFFYNGGGDSQDTAQKVAMLGERMGYPITCIGIPKTVDNDLAVTDCCPGFGSNAKYIAVSTREAGMDVRSMAESSTKLFVLEVMGRHTGWIAAASGLAAEHDGDPPHVILFPEVRFDPEAFYARVDDAVQRYGYCVIVVSEGLQDADGNYLADGGSKDAFGHTQLGGVGPVIARLCSQRLGYKHHCAVADYLQRSARHLASKTDVDQAYAVGRAAVERALAGENAIMPTIVRRADEPYQWEIGSVPLPEVANVERNLPPEYISADGFGITDACRRYMRPLIQGEDYPPYRDGLPAYVALKNASVPRRLSTEFDV